ncbi:MAG: 2-amino-4-hydroxy-6-hydroxymethyldihydropteridine diphosphokinase [Acidobacteriota bacterium]
MQSDKTNIRIFIALGSNLGDREAHLSQALERIIQLGFRLVAASSKYETEPVGYQNQGWFLNQVIEVALTEQFFKNLSESQRTQIDLCFSNHLVDLASLILADATLPLLHQIEESLGRKREFINGPREIDIDLLLFGNAHFQSLDSTAIKDFYPEVRSSLAIPHPRMHLRRFVLEPLCEIAPEMVHPVLKKTCAELLAALNDRYAVKRLAQ